MKKNIYSVSKINSYIKNLFVHDYVLNDIRIKGEISNLKEHGSGHIYFTLKDETSTISCVFLNRYREYISFDLQEGMSIVARGYVSVYEVAGRYQLYVQQAKLDGVGNLYEKFENLKKELDKKGYFNNNHKKKIPQYPSTLGIVTSDTGAAIRDLINIAQRRNPYVQLVLYPSLVQGDQAADNIVKGIQYLDKLENIDTIIIGRGGGSIEDLWAFNEINVAEAIFEANKPIISAVGHETDFTISDFVADLRAPTPSAAMELAVPSIDEVEYRISQMEYRLITNINSKLDKLKDKSSTLYAQLKYCNPEYKLEQLKKVKKELEIRLNSSINNIVKEYKHQYNLLEKILEPLSPEFYLKKGYAYIENYNGEVVTKIKNIRTEDDIRIYMIDGSATANVKDKKYKNIATVEE